MNQIPVYIEDLKKIYYPDKVVLEDIDLEVCKGESIGILGCNGSGKTTLLRILSTLTYPSYGLIEIFGMDPRIDAKKIKQLIGFLPERFSFYPYFSVNDIITFFENLTPINRKDQEEIREQIISLLKIESYLDVKINALSKGMLHKIGLAITLIHDPALLLLDEPTSGLDPLIRFEVRKVLKKFSDDPDKTVIISSHILEDVELVCDRVFFLESGRMLYWPFKISEMKEKLKKLQKLEIRINNEVNSVNADDLGQVLFFTQNSGFLEIYCFRNQLNEIKSLIKDSYGSEINIQRQNINLEDLYVLNHSKINWLDLLE